MLCRAAPLIGERGPILVVTESVLVFLDRIRFVRSDVDPEVVKELDYRKKETDYRNCVEPKR